MVATVDDVIRLYVDHFGEEPGEQGRGFGSDFIEQMLDAMDADTPLISLYEDDDLDDIKL